MRWNIGCSGFSYKEWKGTFYPEEIPQRKWFEYYAEKFNTLELNNTFYKFPELKTLSNWYDRSPGNFLFAVKAPRLITHYKKFHDCTRFLDDFYSTVLDGMKEKLGAVLFQLPSNIHYDESFTDKLIESLNTQATNVVEFRHKSWWREDVYKKLEEAKIIFCGINYPSLPQDVITVNKIAYYRFHGNPKLYYSQYKSPTLQKVADEINGAKKIKEAFIFFNNTANMSAIKNANKLKEIIGQ